MDFFHSLPVPEFWEWDFFIPFPFPKFGNGFFYSLPVPEFREWAFSIPFPFPNFGNGLFQFPSRSRTLKSHSRSPLLQNALDSDLPFFTNNTDMVKKCLQEQHCDFLQDIHQNFGKKYIFFYFLLSCCHRRQQCLKRTIPVPSPLDSGRERESSSICTCSLLLLSRGD